VHISNRKQLEQKAAAIFCGREHRETRIANIEMLNNENKT